MNNLITEILLTFLIFSLLLMVIPLVHSTTGLMAEMAVISFSTPDSPETSLPPDTLEGIDVAAVVEYYSSEPGVSIHLSNDEGEKTYTDTTLDEDPFPYGFSYSYLYHTNIVEEDGIITEIFFKETKE